MHCVLSVRLAPSSQRMARQRVPYARRRSSPSLPDVPQASLTSSLFDPCVSSLAPQDSAVQRQPLACPSLQRAHRALSWPPISPAPTTVRRATLATSAQERQHSPNNAAREPSQQDHGRKSASSVKVESISNPTARLRAMIVYVDITAVRALLNPCHAQVRQHRSNAFGNCRTHLAL